MSNKQIPSPIPSLFLVRFELMCEWDNLIHFPAETKAFILSMKEKIKVIQRNFFSANGLLQFCLVTILIKWEQFCFRRLLCVQH